MIFNRDGIFSEIFKLSRYPWNKIYKREFIKEYKIYFSDNRHYEDNIFYFLAMIYAEKISIINKKYYNYVSNRDGCSTNKKNRPLALIEVNKEIKDRISNANIDTKYIQRFESYNVRRCASYYYRIHKSYRREYFEKMRREFLKIDITRNPFLDLKKRLFCLLVRTVPYSIFKYSNHPVYTLLYLYTRIMKKPKLNLY